MIRGVGAAIAIAGGLMGLPAASGVTYDVLDWSELSGWSDDDHAEALSVFLETCPDLTEEVWSSICAVATQESEDPRTFFEVFFRPVLISESKQALFTGYFEPELRASRTRTDRFRHPIYRFPPEIPIEGRWFTRREIENGRLLEDRDLEIAWLDDPVDAFFLQIQGSGRIAFTDGSRLRVGYGGSNRHEYRSVGQEMIRRGTLEANEVSAANIKRWVQDNPVEGRELLRFNPSYTFFREIDDLPANAGPIGAMNRSVTPMRTVAVDPEFVPLGAPVWIEKNGREPIQRLMIAQDTGSAIKGAQRADIFFGTGEAAGQRAGRIRDSGRMVVLLPIELAFELAPEG